MLKWMLPVMTLEKQKYSTEITSRSKPFKANVHLCPLNPFLLMSFITLTPFVFLGSSNIHLLKNTEENLGPGN